MQTPQNYNERKISLKLNKKSSTKGEQKRNEYQTLQRQ